MSKIQGVITAMVTVFDGSGNVDFAGSRKLARHLVEHGSQGLVVAGTTGESPTLDDQEKLGLLDAVLAEVGTEATVILGSGSNDTRHSVELTKAAADHGAHAGLVVTPYYNRPNKAGLRGHFEAVAAGSPELPLILYNIPGRVVVNLGPDFLGELAEIPNVVAVKQANDEEIRPIPGLDLLAGNDTGFLSVLKCGGTGGILVASHLVGERMLEIYNRFREGDVAGAERIDTELQPAYEAMAVTVNPIPVKAALEMAGLCSAHMRLPMVEATDTEKQQIRRLLASSGVEL
ncbi:MAG: 4-hydroxy-tetrahydrodipicolinate synthase [Solirubrobacterales bacterium]